MDTYRRSRSQSRFPPPPPEGYHREGFLDHAHRSKSLDNRRDWNRDEDQWYDPPTGGGFGARGGGGGVGAGGGNFPRGGKHYDQGQEFFNETVTIPIQKEGAQGGDVAVQRSAAVAAQYEAQGLDNESFSYDRKVHVENDRKVNIYPSRRRQYYEEHYRGGGGGGGYAAGAGYPPPPQGISPRSAGTRYADSEYHYRQQQAQAQQRPLEYTRSAESRFDDQTTVGQREHTGTLGTRSGIGGGGGAAHRSYQYHREAQYGGGGSASRHAAGATNGFSGGHKHEWGARSWSGPSGRKEGVHHKVRCCCFSFYWPPWGYEPVGPPRPMYATRPPPPPGPPGPY